MNNIISDICIPSINKEFIDYLEADGLNRLQHFIDTVIADIHTTLEVMWIPNDEILLVTTWSDGRMENVKNASSFQLLLYHLWSTKEAIIDALIIHELQKHNKDTVDVRQPWRWWLALEVKNSRSPHYYEWLNHQIFFPSIFIDAYKMYGSSDHRKTLSVRNSRVVYTNDCFWLTSSS
jgi:hypothetical protein